MAGAVETNSISDDWSDVGDTASVKSASSFDDDDEFCLLPELSAPPKASIASSSKTPKIKEGEEPPKYTATDFEKQPLYASTHREHKPTIQPPQIVSPEPAEVVEASPEEQPTAPIPIDATKKQPERIDPFQFQDDEADLADSKSSNESSPDYDDPEVYYGLLIDLYNNLGEIIEQADGFDATYVPAIVATKSTCQQLSKSVEELKLIYAAYAGSWTTDGVEVPLSPDLLSWMTQVRTELEKVRVLLSEVEGNGKVADFKLHNGCRDVDGQLNQFGHLTNCCETLNSAHINIQNFSTIIKADFDEFKTSSMKFPRYQAPPKESRREPPNPSISRIRRELYKLKDELQTTLVFLSRLQYEVPAGTLDNIGDAVRSLKNLIVAISTMLTNNGSDWLDRDLGTSSHRIIPYSTFINLDADVLYDITKHIQEFYQQLDVGDEPLFRRYSSVMIRNHQVTSLTEGGQMYNLLSITSLLESILMVQA